MCSYINLSLTAPVPRGPTKILDRTQFAIEGTSPMLDTFVTRFIPPAVKISGSLRHGGSPVAATMSRRLHATGLGLLLASLTSAAYAAEPLHLATPAPEQIESCNDGPDYTCGCGKQHALRLRAAAGKAIYDQAPAASYANREAYTATDLISCDLDIEINPTNSTISGSNIMRVKSLVNGLTQFTVMLRSQYVVTGATINGATPISVPLPASGSYARTITLDRAYQAGQEFTLRIPYSGTAVSRGFGSIEFGTQPGTSNPIIATLSEAYFAATWWPCKDGDVFAAGDNGDKFTMRMAVTAPASLTSVSNGPRESVVTLSGNRRKFTYASGYPVSTYLVMFASSVYNTWSTSYVYTPDGGGAARTMPLNFYIYPANDTPGNRAAWQQTSQMLATFRPLFGLYPFVEEQYGIYQFPFGGGMEHQTMSGQGTFDEGVTAHELGHQWWGDHVTCKTWNHIWLNEGFATYSEALWSQYKPGSSGFPALQSSMNSRKPSDPGDSVYVVNVGDMNRIFSSAYSYRKAAWVLHQLRRVVGETAFFTGLQQYRAAFGGSAATTEDFAASMSATSGTDLSNFFRQQVYGVGAPNFSVGYQNVTISGIPYARVSLQQTQNPAWPGIGSPGNSFALPVDLRLSTPAGSVDVTVNHKARLEHYLIALPAATNGITVDPSGWILTYNKVTAAYVNGPAKVVSIAPAPAAILSDAPASVIVMFSENVSSTPAAFSIAGPLGPVAFTHAYNAALLRTTLTPTSPLESGTYSVTMNAAALTTVTAGIALDGEVNSPVAFPSGDGQPGGNTVVTFTIEAAPCPADFNQDGGIDGVDVEAFFIAWQAAEPEADINTDGGVDGGDVETFFLLWSAGAC